MKITNGLLREYLPKGADLSMVSQERLYEVAELPDTRQGETLGGKFPVEVLVGYSALAEQ